MNRFVEKARKADGFVFGTPVYYAHPSGRVLSFLDRAQRPEPGGDAAAINGAANARILAHMEPILQ